MSRDISPSRGKLRIITQPSHAFADLALQPYRELISASKRDIVSPKTGKRPISPQKGADMPPTIAEQQRIKAKTLYAHRIPRPHGTKKHVVSPQLSMCGITPPKDTDEDKQRELAVSAAVDKSHTEKVGSAKRTPGSAPPTLEPVSARGFKSRLAEMQQNVHDMLEKMGPGAVAHTSKKAMKIRTVRTRVARGVASNGSPSHKEFADRLNDLRQQLLQELELSPSGKGSPASVASRRALSGPETTPVPAAPATRPHTVDMGIRKEHWQVSAGTRSGVGVGLPAGDTPILKGSGGSRPGSLVSSSQRVIVRSETGTTASPAVPRHGTRVGLRPRSPSLPVALPGRQASTATTPAPEPSPGYTATRYPPGAPLPAALGGGRNPGPVTAPSDFRLVENQFRLNLAALAGTADSVQGSPGHLPLELAFEVPTIVVVEEAFEENIASGVTVF